ncbi:T6SS effector amidase Tae4 family protein [Roseateles chitinivorans]|uniref:T6SS effector amidase Tae4 family protein n=1 Tax=Roseateles chitinivorans TaxID=2917965 RepID=UPI003D67BB58
MRALFIGPEWHKKSRNFRHGHTASDKPKYPIRAEELATWLDKNAAVLPGKIQKSTGKDVATSFEKIKGKQGVIFIKDYYGPGLSGDHIDLSKESRMTDTSSWFRIATGFAIQGFWSDYRKAKAIWFWQMT